MVIAGRYRLEERIGAGGMGEVYRATHLELAVPVAVKLIGATIAGLELAVKRFRREARAAARLKSVHIVHVHDFGVDHDVPFLAMELLEGESLSRRLQRLGKLSLRDASALLDQAGRGLSAAHAQGVVHRDVKPSNCFVARTADGEVLKLLDFGIAKPADEDVTVTSSHEVVGSPLYMSPEQVNGADVDARADVWALAAIAFRMVTGIDAFAAPTTAAVLGRICSGRLPRASAHVPELPARVDAFFERAFDPAIERRFPSAAALTESFAKLASDETEDDGAFFRTAATASLPGLPRLPATKPRIRRWPWLAGVAALAAAAGLTFALEKTPSVVAGSENSDVTPPAPREPAPAPAPAPDVLAEAERAVPAAAQESASATPAAPRPRLALPKTKAKAAPSPSTGAAPTDRKVRDPLFGL